MKPQHKHFDRTPYTYSLLHLVSGNRYYGVRWGKNCHPSELWITYFSSSKYILGILEREGLEAFSYRVSRVFSNVQDAKLWEHKVLSRVKAATNPKMLNRHEGGTFPIDGFPSWWNSPSEYSIKRHADSIRKYWETRTQDDMKTYSKVIRDRISKRTPEEIKRWSDDSKRISRSTWNNMPPEERARRSLLGVKQWENLTSEEKQAISISRKVYWENLSEEEKAKRRKIAGNWWENRTPEEQKALCEKHKARWRSYSAEEKASKAEKTKLGKANLSEQRKREISRKHADRMNSAKHRKCKYCGLECHPTIFPRWHDENCKHKIKE